MFFSLISPALTDTRRAAGAKKKNWLLRLLLAVRGESKRETSTVGAEAAEIYVSVRLSYNSYFPTDFF
jgi:head-tail adaptor